MVIIRFTRPVNNEELREIATLVRNQETTDKYVSTTLHIDGNDASIDVEVDEDGDITIL